MVENLPLIPRKGAVCADVRPVLREVFKEEDYLPPLATDRHAAASGQDGDNLTRQEEWNDKYIHESNEIWVRESKLKHEHARRLAKDPLPNIYHLASPASGSEVSAWKLNHGIIRRKDLVPRIEQDAGRDGSLWVQNILNRSSCDVSCMEVRGSRLYLPLNLTREERSVQSMSIGKVEFQPPLLPPPVSLPPPSPEYIVCVPPQLDFVNFTVGHLHTQTLHFVNVSKFEIRLSIRPPSRRELDLMICGPRGPSVSSGATAELRVQFTPRDVRALYDELFVRVSIGKSLCVPVHCFMLPPVLHVLIPSVNWSSLTCSTDEMAVHSGGDVLELGTRLLGDVHCARLLLHCDAEHAAFFMLTDDAWVSLCLDTLTPDGAVIAGPFTISPAWWKGGGSVRGSAWCRAPHAGLHVAAMRILASTAVARTLHILADTLLFSPEHITLEAQDKDYDICSDDDSQCKYYVHLGTAFPNRCLSASVTLVNHSAVLYSYYWSVRPWGVCSCWEADMAVDGSFVPGEDSEDLCVGAKEAKAQQDDKGSARAQAASQARLIRVEPTCGSVAPRSRIVLHVCVPDAGANLGPQRAVLMLIMKDIPIESFPPDYDPLIVKSETVPAEKIPGQQPWSYETCEVVCCQMEVWWEVVPVRFVLDPPFLELSHSRRVKEVELVVRVTQLYGCDGVCAEWDVPPHMPAPPRLPRLTPVHSTSASLTVPLPILINEVPQTDVFVLEARNKEWCSQSTVIRQCATRHPRLRPARAWLGVVPPGAHVTTDLHLFNDTHQHICWWSTPYRWYGENEPSALCQGKQVCEHCHERACTCALLRPTRGGLLHHAEERLVYAVNAPEKDGCVVTLIRTCRTLGDLAYVPSSRGCDARASLVSYRVLAPRVHLRALPCHGEKIKDVCEDCNLDCGTRKAGGTAVLRPSSALTLGRCTCYRLRFTNITSLPTTIRWEPPIEKEDVLKVTFLPNDFDLRGFGQVEIRVVIEARKVCGRKVYVYRALVDRAYKPIYLLIDTAVTGLEVTCEVPIGGKQHTSATVIMKRSQKELFPWDEIPTRTLTPEEVFAQEDRIRATRADNTCHCKYKMVYIPPVKPLRQPDPEQTPEIEIVCDPPPLTRVCECCQQTKPVMPDYPEPFCLQFQRIPLKTVRSRTVVLTNLSVLTARWSAVVRNWPRKRHRTIVHAAPGVCAEVSPPGGVLGAHAQLALTVSVYADCWGLYRDQILIHIEKLEPIVLELWVEAVGQPLQLAMNPQDEEVVSTLWMSTSDPERVVRFTNTSRSDLVVHAYVLLEHEHAQDIFPFRMYLRSFDVLPRICPCVTAFDSEESGEDSVSGKVESEGKLPEDMDTGFEVFFTADYGLQEDTYFKVEPAVSTVAAGASAELRVTLVPPEHANIADNAVLLLRLLPLNFVGPGWYRREQPPQLLRLRHTHREGMLRASERHLRVRLCALDLPYGEVMRLRKSLRIKNVGNGPLSVTAATKSPWTILLEEQYEHSCTTNCGCVRLQSERVDTVPLYLLPNSSMEMVVEVCIDTANAWPTTSPASNVTSPCFKDVEGKPPVYKEWQRATTLLSFYDDDNVLLTVPLILELEFPILRVEPTTIDFGFVADGDTRKKYFTVTHSSRVMTLDLVTEWTGSEDFVLWPQKLRLPPGACERVYVQYKSKWRDGLVEGYARVQYALGGAEGAGTWCRTALLVHAVPARDLKCHLSVHDHTDNPTLLPDGLSFVKS